MEISRETEEFVREVGEFSHHRLKTGETLATLIEVARRSGKEDLLRRIAFRSKFLSNAYGILKRSTAETEGYEKLTREFNENLEKVVEELRELVENAPPETKEALFAHYLSMTGGTFENLLTLLYDFSWVKNWYIDHEAPVR